MNLSWAAGLPITGSLKPGKFTKFITFPFVIKVRGGVVEETETKLKIEVTPVYIGGIGRSWELIPFVHLLLGMDFFL